MKAIIRGNILVLGADETLTPGKTFHATVRIVLDAPTRVCEITARIYDAERKNISFCTGSTMFGGTTLPLKVA